MIHFTYGQLCHVPGAVPGGGVWNNGSAPAAARWRFDKRDYMVSPAAAPAQASKKGSVGSGCKGAAPGWWPIGARWAPGRPAAVQR